MLTASLLEAVKHMDCFSRMLKPKACYPCGEAKQETSQSIPHHPRSESRDIGEAKNGDWLKIEGEIGSFCPIL